VPVALVLGADPAALLAGRVPLPSDLDPLLFAGFLRRAPVDLAPAKTVELDVPIVAEYVLEGYVTPGERRPYGPFGERTGHYGEPAEAAVFHLTGLTHRRDPLFPATASGRAAIDELWLAKAAERLFMPFVRLLQPEVVDLSAPVEGGFANLLLVSIRQSYPGQAQKVIAGLYGVMPTLLAKAIVVFDADADLSDLAGCARRVALNVDWRRDLIVLDGPIDPLDHSAPRRQVGAKIGIDATRKLVDERHPRPWPREVAMSPEVRALVDRKWAAYGIPL
jgi:4-hydroxy-3-polyprenylbenzoate decarboxylase